MQESLLKMPQVSVNCIWMANNLNNTGLFSDDIFTIDEIAVYEGTHNDQTYAVAGDILDGVCIFKSTIF